MMALAAAPHEGTLRRLSDLLVRRHNLLVLILLVPPLLWLGMVYLGSLFVFLAQSIFSIDEFSGTIVREPTLATLAELFRPANFDILMRTVGIAAAVTLLSAVIGSYLFTFSPSSAAVVGLVTATFAVLADLAADYAEAGRQMAGDRPTLWVARHMQGPLGGIALAAPAAYVMTVLFLT